MSKYDGDTKNWTRDCDGCPYRTSGDALCYWGVAIKLLYQTKDKLRKCEYRLREPPPNSAWWHNRILIKRGKSQPRREEQLSLPLF